MLNVEVGMTQLNRTSVKFAPDRPRTKHPLTLHLTLIVCSWHHVLASSVRPIVVNISQERIEGISLKVGTNVLLDSRRIRLDFVCDLAKSFDVTQMSNRVKR